MNNTVLIIYDNTGRVWGIYSNETTVPEGVQGIIATAPTNGFKSVSVDVTKTPHEAVFEENPDTEIEVESIQDTVIDHEERLLALEEALLGGNA